MKNEVGAHQLSAVPLDQRSLLPAECSVHGGADVLKFCTDTHRTD